MSALEIQEFYLAQAQDFLARQGPHHDYIDQIMDLWSRTLQAISSQDFSSIDTEIDWAIKHKFMTAYAKKNNLDWDAARLVQLDMSYHDTHPQRGLFHLLDARGAAARVLTDAQIQAAHDNPPATTRALLRHRFIETARAMGMEYSMDWMHMKLNYYPMHTLYVRNPFETDISIVDELFAKVASASD
jgi:proteasome accessory factor A